MFNFLPNIINPSKKESSKNNRDGEFNYELIKELYINSSKNLISIPHPERKIILLTTGSFNPIHRMHLSIFDIATNFLKSNGYEVLCGLISPSADCYVSHKQPPLIPFEKRCELVKNGIIEQKCTVPVFLHKWEGSQTKFFDFPDVISKIQKDVNDYIGKDVDVIYVCGMDHFIKCRYALRKNVIAVDREPYMNNFYENDIKRKIFCIKDKNTKPYSSTEIKKLIELGGEDNINKVKEITYDSVAKFYIDFYRNNK